jgi:hypothetical protein
VTDREAALAICAFSITISLSVISSTTTSEVSGLLAETVLFTGSSSGETACLALVSLRSGVEKLSSAQPAPAAARATARMRIAVTFL